MRTLAAIMAWATMAVDADLAGPIGARNARAVGIDDMFSMLFCAATLVAAE